MGIFFSAALLIVFQVINLKQFRHLWLNDTTSVVHEVQSLSDLVTVKYILNKVVVLEDVKWYSASIFFTNIRHEVSNNSAGAF